MRTRFAPFLAFLVLFAMACACAHAEALVKPVPTPDLSKAPAATADALRKARADFEKAKLPLVGDALAAAYAELGAIYARAGFTDAADVALEDAALLAPEDGRWVYARGVLARQQGRKAVAQNFFDLALRLDTTYLPIRIAVARMKLQNGDLDGARTLMADYVAQHADQAAAYALLGDIALRQKRYADAVDALQHAIRLQPQASRLYGQLADAQAGAGNAKAAAEARAKAGPVEPVLADPLADGLLGRHAAAATPAATAAAALANDPVAQAARLLQARKYDEARRALDGVLAAKPRDALALALYARIEAAAGNLPQARARAEAAVAADPASAVAELSHGIALEMAGDDAGAQRAYEHAIQLDAKLAEPRSLLGDLLMRTGRNADAIGQYRALVQLDLHDVEAWMHLVGAYGVAGRCKDALRDTQDVLAHDAGNSFVLQLFVRLASTCPAATPQERQGALEYGRTLSAKARTPQAGEAYALALAANGKWDEAVKTQEAAMFLLVRNGLKLAVAPYREVLTRLRAHALPDRPWPADAAVYHPQRLAPDPRPVATTPAKKPER
jgi:tetratricopeptide (TPR) repeat protein